jgi:DNA-binding transcriptional regulator YdaS (Cro superfamily)
VNAKMRTMQRAVQALGGEQALADTLGVRREDVAQWLSGAASPQDAAYLAALDIVARSPIGWSRAGPK